MMADRDQAEGNRDQLFSGDRVSTAENEKLLETADSDQNTRECA
jgi:hypothetical protein